MDNICGIQKISNSNKCCPLWLALGVTILVTKYVKNFENVVQNGNANMLTAMYKE